MGKRKEPQQFRGENIGLGLQDLPPTADTVFFVVYMSVCMYAWAHKVMFRVYSYLCNCNTGLLLEVLRGPYAATEIEPRLAACKK